MLSFGLSDVGVLLCAIWAVNYVIWKGWFSSYKLPPSYYGFPIIGVIPFLIWHKNHLDAIQDLSKKNGPVFRVKVGSKDVVVVNGANAVKEALKNDDLLGRPPLYVFNILEDIIDAEEIVTMEGPDWKEIRNFSMSSLRELGLGKTPKMELQIQAEVTEFIAALESSNGQPLDCTVTLSPSVTNNIVTVLFGDRQPYTHPKIQIYIKLLSAFTKSANLLISLNFVPRLLDLLRSLGKFADIEKAGRDAKKQFNAEISSHLDNLDENDKRDFLDYILTKQKTAPKFTPPVIRGCIVDFFGAGSNTTLITVEYLFHLCAAYPELQEEMYQDIMREVGADRPPCWADQENLPLLRAFLAERHRIYSVAPLGLFRKALRDTKVCGLDIRRGTTVVTNLHSVHYDPEYFDEPEKFNPKRFIKDGKFANAENVIPFAIGKRACPGESFAIFQSFLYFASVLQRFKIVPDKPVILCRSSKLFADPAQQTLKYMRRS